MVELVSSSEDYAYIKECLKICNDEDYITEDYLDMDFKNKELYCLKYNNKIVAIASLVYDSDFKEFYIKRALSFVEGRGYMKEMISKLSVQKNKVYITPFEENKKMIKIISSLGFSYKYNFLTDYMLFEKIN